MAKLIIFAIAFIGFITGCEKKGKVEETNLVFKTPVISNIGLTDTLAVNPFPANFVTEASPVFMGKFRFSDTIDIFSEVNKSLINDFILDKEYKALDSLGANGFDLVVDYKQTIHFNMFSEISEFPEMSELNYYFPVYLVNSTSSNKFLLGKDGHGFGIQEAFDTTTYSWVPIEARHREICGNGSWGLIVKPNEFVVFLVRKYEGDLQTNLRFRLANGESIFVSKPYKGRIKSSQFSVEDSSYIKHRLLDTKEIDKTWQFFGAIPKKAWLSY